MLKIQPLVESFHFDLWSADLLLVSIHRVQTLHLQLGGLPVDQVSLGLVPTAEPPAQLLRVEPPVPQLDVRDGSVEKMCVPEIHEEQRVVVVLVGPGRGLQDRLVVDPDRELGGGRVGEPAETVPLGGSPAHLPGEGQGGEERLQGASDWRLLHPF